MLYDYKSDELVQDVILEDVETLVDDVIEEFYSLRRYNELNIYTTSSVAREIISELLEFVDELWVHVESENDLLYKDGNEVLITIANDGMVFVESARGNNGQIKSNEDCSLTYLYDGFDKKDVDDLAENAESILVFGFENDDLDDECSCSEFVKCPNCVCTESEKKPVSETATKENFFVNGKSVSKEEFDKKYAEFEDKYMDNIRDMLLRYCDLMDSFNEWQKMFW